ncbi:MAG: phage holin family protein [Salinibacter sp.]
METFQDRSSASDEGSSARSTPDGRLGRIAGHTRGLVDDLREWIDLRLDLAILELEERVDELRNEVALGITLAFFGFFAALFVFVTVALGLGWVLGHPFWGFLIVSAALVLFVSVLARARPDLAPPSNLFSRLRGRLDDAAASSDPESASSPPEDAS